MSNKKEEIIYRHCQEKDGHWKCSGFGDEGECDCPCHKKSTPPETSECSFNHQELPNCDVCEKLGCKHIPETPEWEKGFEVYYAQTIGIVADEEILSGKYAPSLLEQKEKFKSFISTLLQKEKKKDRAELLDEIKYHKEMPIQVSHQSLEEQRVWDWKEGYNEAVRKINQALQLIKEQKLQ